MTVEGLFRGYKRWSPVHPTFGAFRGMGIGLGCGVGWGPGFGPDVVGYVGAGCGLGFSVGITLIGVGVGLPVVSGITCLPYKLFLLAADEALRVTSSHVIPILKFRLEQTWTALVVRSSSLESGVRDRYHDLFLSKGREAMDSLRIKISSTTQSIPEIESPTRQKFYHRLQVKALPGLQEASKQVSPKARAAEQDIEMTEVAEKFYFELRDWDKNFQIYVGSGGENRQSPQ
ncbi:hypothetical protein AXG93_3104s1050 [Marchantia polymorpha subsp. ruderalis]|uniref:Uncharacterized protein n=1 Tax=Marchantia polymorpha subsp. ruderalis TaxID=1480154 RepID=A0A176WRW2_MARPO|nr:hypothetical protein AXG93_3104s1050 [Marchantia polymorpha subsp. ruderalis]